MWFKRKAKNRRLGRAHVLDVKLRSSQIRAARTRIAAVTLGVVFTTVLGAWVVWRCGEWALNRLVYENKAFTIEEIDVQTDGILSVDQLRRWTGTKPGQNLLALDLARVKRDLELVSQVQSASVERVLPHTLKVRIIEREPLAQICLPRPGPGGSLEMTSFQLDAGGFLMAPLDPKLRTAPPASAQEPLPLIAGLNSNEIQAGRRVELPSVLASLQLIQEFERSPMAGLVDLKRIDVSAPDALVITTSQGSEIIFGLGDLERQFRRWQVIYDFGLKNSKAIATLDLAVTNNVPARWVEASSVPQTLPKPPKAPRKRHV